MYCRNKRHDTTITGRDADGSCSECRRDRVRRGRDKTANAVKAAKGRWVDFDVPTSVWVDNSFPNVQQREHRIAKALRLGRKAEAAGDQRLAWNYFVFAEAVGRGVFIPDEDRVLAVFGHAI